MPERYNTANIIKILDVIIEAGNVAPRVAAAGGVVGKVAALLPLTDELAALITLSPAMVVKEWQDLSERERYELMEHAKDKYDISDELVESKTETGLELVNEAITLIHKAAQYAKTFT